MSSEHTLSRTLLSCFVLVSLFVLLPGCHFVTSLEGTRPVPLATAEPQTDPYVYGTGERMLVFAAVGGNVLDVRRTTGPIVDYLGHRLGVRFRLSYFRRYPDIIEAMVRGEADFAWLGPTTYLAIRQHVPCRPVAQILRDGVGYYEGVILVKIDKGYTSLRDLEGKVFAFIDKKSTSGYIYPSHFLRRQGIERNSFFGRIEYAGGHSNALLRLMNGSYDAVCTERDILKRLADKVDTNQLQVLAVTGRIPNGPIAAHPKLDEAFIARAARILTMMVTDPEGAELLAELRSYSNFSGFGPVSEETYGEVQSIVAESQQEAP